MVESVKRLVYAALNDARISEWLRPDGHASFLQDAFDARCKHAVDLGEGAVDFLARHRTVQRTNATFYRAAASLSEASESMTPEQWHLCMLILSRAGVVRVVYD